MQIQTLRLEGFRAHADTTIRFEPGVNLVHGPNGIGKTNLLEAIHVAALAKSFLTHSDRYILRKGADFYRVSAEFAFDEGRSRKSTVTYTHSEGKQIRVNGVPLERLVEVVGQFPLVVLSPDDHRLTDGGPDERRRLVDTVLCQAYPGYLDALMRYRRALKQRNNLLSVLRSADERQLAPWTAALARHGSRVIARRDQFLNEFQGYLDQAFGHLGGSTERPRLRYRPSIGMPDQPSPTPDETEAHVLARVQEVADHDVERNTTTRGPHRDEVVFTLNDLPVRHYGSQGQHRTFVMALRLAEHLYLKDRKGTTPLLLLDDAFDNLDPARIRSFLELLHDGPVEQTIVTAARPDLFSAVGDYPVHSIALNSDAITLPRS